MKTKFISIVILFIICMFSFIGVSFASSNNDIVVDSNNMIIKNINIGTSFNNLIDNIGYSASNVTFYRESSIISGNHYSITGDRVKTNNTGNEYKLSVRGDVLSEGKISIEGIKKVARHIINNNVLSNEYLFAADYNFDGNIKMNDVILMLKNLDSNSSLVTNPVTINYEKSNNGKFIFINNPEGIRKQFLADSNYGNRLIYRDEFSGNMELYYEHSTYEDVSIAYRGNFYYAIKFSNNGNNNVTLTINSSGSTVNNWTLTWKKYYNSNNNVPQTNYVIKPGESLYFYHSNNNPYSFVNEFSSAYKFSGYVGFDGVLNVTSSGKLFVETMAFNDKTKINGASYPGNVESVSDKANLRVISGSTNSLPDLYNNVTFVIDDTVNSGDKLMIVCTNNNAYDHWITNYVGAWSNSNLGIVYPANENTNCVYKEDMLPISFTSELGNYVTIRPFYSGVSESYDNRSIVIEAFGAPLQFGVANWAVHYHENITLINNGKNTRTVSFVMKPTSRSTYSIVQDTVNASSNVNYIENSNKFFTADSENPENVVIWKVEIDPGQTIKVPAIITLGGMSSGIINKYIYIDL